MNKDERKFDELSSKIIGSAIEVHKTLGPGLLESTYEKCLFYELQRRDINVQNQISLPVKYKEITIENSYRIGLLIDNKIIVELKSVSEITQIHEAQILTYMKLSGIKIGLLINFNVKWLKNGIHRFVL